MSSVPEGNRCRIRSRFHLSAASETTARMLAHITAQEFPILVLVAGVGIGIGIGVGATLGLGALKRRFARR